MNEEGAEGREEAMKGSSDGINEAIVVRDEGGVE